MKRAKRLVCDVCKAPVRLVPEPVTVSGDYGADGCQVWAFRAFGRLVCATALCAVHAFPANQ